MSEPDPNRHPTDMPPGPWLAVLGMHRSGTSAITGALGALGFATPSPDDRMDWPESNPEHWESSSITVYDDELLADLGGSWEAPPDLPPRWEEGVVMRNATSPVAVATAAFPHPGPLVWKDPRLCILLPYWLRVLPAPLATVLVWRSPLAVARSLEQRDGMYLADGIALWERYNRSALEHLVSLDTYVCNYEALVDDPLATIGSLADWLGSLPQFLDHSPRWNRDGAATTIAAEPAPGPDSDAARLLPQHRELISRLTAYQGGHRPLGPTSLMSESGWTTALLAARRGSRSRELAGLETRVQDKQTELDRLRQSTSWRITSPLRSLVSALKGRGHP